MFQHTSPLSDMSCRKICQQNSRKRSEITETDIVNGYEISWHVCINMLFIYRACAFASKIKLVLNPLAISSYQWFTGCVEGIYGMLLNGNRAVRVLHYRSAVAISAQRYVWNCVLRVSRCRRAVTISASRYIRIIRWLTVYVFKKFVLSNCLFHKQPSIFTTTYTTQSHGKWPNNFRNLWIRFSY